MVTGELSHTGSGNRTCSQLLSISSALHGFFRELTFSINKKSHFYYNVKIQIHAHKTRTLAQKKKVIEQRQTNVYMKKYSKHQ